MKVVILAGGAGTRFWPRSVKDKPKQFLTLTSDRSLLQETFQRFRSAVPLGDIYVVTAAQYAELVREQLPHLPEGQLILEPDQRDTAPCTALAALHFIRRNIDDVLITAPSDHYIPQGNALISALKAAEDAAGSKHAIVALGITPTRPETGYGYMEAEAAPAANGLYRVKTFIEKPTADVADTLIRDRHVFWNSGIFVWKPSTIAYYMKQLQPDLWKKLSDHYPHINDIYASLEKQSVDYAILEKADNVFMIPVTFTWDDLGSWSSLYRVFQPDESGNIVIGNVDALRTSNSIIYADQRKAAVIGVNDLIIVSTEAGLLVCHKRDEHRIKEMVQKFL